MGGEQSGFNIKFNTLKCLYLGNGWVTNSKKLVTNGTNNNSSYKSKGIYLI